MNMKITLKYRKHMLEAFASKEINLVDIIDQMLEDMNQPLLDYEVTIIVDNLGE